MAKSGRCETCDRYYQNLDGHMERKHKIYGPRFHHEPTLCTCEIPDPIPNGLGECAGCRRLILSTIQRDENG